MGLFSIKLPKCPRCGGATVRTGYAYPFPQLRCNRCCDEHEENKRAERRIAELERKIDQLTQTTTNE